MPIDIMSPIQALQHSAMAYKGVRESEKHLELQKQKLNIDKQNADSKTKIADAKSKEAEAKKVRADKMLTPEQQLQISRDKRLTANANAREAKQKTELQRINQNMGLQYRDYSNEMINRANNSLQEDDSAIRNSQPNFKVGE